MEDSQPCGACSDSTLIGEVAEGCGCSSEEGEAPGGRCAEGGCGGESSMAATDTSPISTLEDMDTVYAAWTSNTFLPCTDWVPGGGVNFIRVRWELLDRTGNLRLAPGFQVANRENAPGAFNNIGSQQTADGFYEINWTDVRSYTDDKQLIRLGWVTRNTSGTALSLGRVRCVYELLLACGSVVRPHFGFAHGLHAGVKEKVEGDLGGFNDRSRVMAVAGWGTAVDRGETRMLEGSELDWRIHAGAFGGDEEAGTSGLLEEVWTEAAGFAKGPGGVVDPVPSDVRDQLDCPGVEPPYIQMPAFALIHPATQECFRLEYNALEWPRSACCDLPLQEVTGCDPPHYSDYMTWVKKTRILNFEDEFRNRPHPPKQGRKEENPDWADPSKEDLILYFSALTLIAQNIDIVQWAACHVEDWSPEIRGLSLKEELTALVYNYGKSPQLAVMFVDIANSVRSPSGGPTAWAIVRGDENPDKDLPVTIVIPLHHDLWKTFRSDYARGGDLALCAVTQLAQIILHEMVHVVGDNFDEKGKKMWRGYGDSSPWSGNAPPYITKDLFGYPGTEHDDNIVDANVAPGDTRRRTLYQPYFAETCWDEARMVASMFVWGIHQRYSCLPDPSAHPWGKRSPCDYMTDPYVFANSILGGG